MKKNPQLLPRYAGIPTFMRCPYQEDLSNLDIALVGIPFDGGVTNRTDARHGPREIRNQSSLMRTINQSTGIAPFDLCNVADIGDALPDNPFELVKSHYAGDQLSLAHKAASREILWRGLREQTNLEVYFVKYQRHYLFFREFEDDSIGIVSVIHERRDVVSVLEKEYGQLY